MSAEIPKPDFQRIKERLCHEVDDYHGRLTIKDQITTLFNHYGKWHQSSCRKIDPIPVDNEGTTIQANKVISNSRVRFDVEMTFQYPHSRPHETREIFYVEEWNVFNHRGEELREDEIQEALSILAYMHEYLKAETASVAQP